MPVITPNLKEQIAELCREYQEAELSLFGSGAREDFDPERSDVDLLVEFLPGTKMGYLRLFELEEQLQQVFRREVHLVPKQGLKPPIRDESAAVASNLRA